MTRQYTRFPAGSKPASVHVPVGAVPELGVQSEIKITSYPLLFAFLLSLMLPLEISLGTVLMTPTRLLLLLSIPILGLRWISGQLDGFRFADFCLFAYGLWAAVCLFVNHGTSQIEFAGISMIEAFGAYLLGRAVVRDVASFTAMVRFLRLALLVLLPFTLIETLLGLPVLLNFFDSISRSYVWIAGEPNYGQRLGMWRAQAVFPHPILYGIFTAVVFALIIFHYDPDKRRPAGVRRAWTLVFNTFFSLSSGAFLALIFGAGLAVWDRMFRFIKGHWWLLLGLVVLGFVAVDVISTRNPFKVFISYASFSAHNGYFRVHIFNYGLANVYTNPVFGLGLRDWVRPTWMGPGSVDNFWLLTAMRYGIPGFFLLLIFWLSAILSKVSLRLNTPEGRANRRAYLVALVSPALAMATVHIWGTLFIFMMFLVGAGAWLQSYAKSDENIAAAAQQDGMGDTGSSVRRRQHRTSAESHRQRSRTRKR